MSFLVNQEGKIMQKNLGANTQTTASKMNSYNPDGTWQAVSN